jgi:glycosyltransferase involved in cell wall biosynthesis
MPACAIFPNSFVQRDFLLKERVASRKLKVLGAGSSNGIDSSFFSATDPILQQASQLKQQTGIHPDGLIWIFVGRMVKDKGIEELLDAFTAIHQQFPHDQLWLLGNEEPELDPLRPAYRDMLHTHPQIKWWGFQKDIRPYLAAAKVLVFPSYREGFPNVPLQAACMGCALILSDINGCNEIVDAGQDGLLVPIKNADALLQSMRTIRKDDTLRVQFSEKIHHKIKNGYDQQQLWHVMLNEYRHRLSALTMDSKR